MKTNVITTASENVTSFVINEDMLNEKKAIKYISKPNMVAAINDICAAIKGLNSLFSPQEYTAAVKKKRENVKNVVVRLKSKRIQRNLSSQPSR